MVFFQCAGCGTDCKKNQVEKHKVQCRRSDVFSCLDCSAEFLGKDYSAHNKCITESQKYEAKNSAYASGGQGQSKGEAKQVCYSPMISTIRCKCVFQNGVNGSFEFVKRYLTY